MSVRVAMSSFPETHGRVYRIVDSSALFWRWVGPTDPYAPRLIWPHIGGILTGDPVEEYQAVELTGLFPPACWDRLREMVQDNAEYRFPPEG